MRNNRSLFFKLLSFGAVCCIVIDNCKYIILGCIEEYE